MGQIALSILPPEYWQDFQRLTLDVCKVMWDVDHADINGREGQEQLGVDVYVYRSDLAGYIGVQCKKRRQLAADGRVLTGGLLNDKEIKAEIESAETFQPPLKHFVIATTALRDEKTQEIIRGINADRISKALFGVNIWFWEHYQEQLNRYSALMYTYYDEVLKSRGEYDQDKHILWLLHTAFSRPAFDTPFRIENNMEDFLQAIADTQEAIKTGKLKNRDREVIESAPKAAKLSKAEWRTVVEEISKLLQEVRNHYTQAIKSGTIEQRERFILLKDEEIGEVLNDLRGRAVHLLNGLLQEADLPLLRSQLESFPRYFLRGPRSPRSYRKGVSRPDS